MYYTCVYIYIYMYVYVDGYIYVYSAAGRPVGRPSYVFVVGFLRLFVFFVAMCFCVLFERALPEFHQNLTGISTESHRNNILY